MSIITFYPHSIMYLGELYLLVSIFHFSGLSITAHCNCKTSHVNDAINAKKNLATAFDLIFGEHSKIL